MKFETNRLFLVAMDLQMIDAAARNDMQVFESLGYKSSDEWPSADFREALPYYRELLVNNNGTRGFDSWIIVEKNTNEIVGGVGFIGDPDPEGMIEIGFGINESHRRKGYCYEAAKALLDRAVNHDEVNRITARCEPDNIGSRTVLEKLGFITESADEEVLHWEYCGIRKSPV
ncbi:GNAT family N-acetyltransferase [Paenibacillus allorhizosphaerae]|uniref:N-acetyltransferase domain-containing protein n=1 Tax=Paenibacillus allorhizosphaerae TaxID=2849866 RepID=A0ABN7TWD0_9BACL|nr:GNAT family N-acetyltransferase [Paenibacillus allorhizosphaerae]CAG7654952.1 hypothetical protein PAECIP111802_05948 [Paenibacillus allorhizosphaerae]